MQNNKGDPRMVDTLNEQEELIYESFYNLDTDTLFESVDLANESYSPLLEKMLCKLMADRLSKEDTDSTLYEDNLDMWLSSKSEDEAISFLNEDWRDIDG